LLITRYFKTEQEKIEAIKAELNMLEQQLDEMKDEHGNEGGLLEDVVEGVGDKRKITAKAIKARLKEISEDEDADDERKALNDYAGLLDKQTAVKGRLNAADDDLEGKVAAKYGKLTEDEIKTLVVDDKWFSRLSSDVESELDRVSHALTNRIRQVAERYANPLPQLGKDVATLSARVDEHLKKMGAVWS
jgi:type I restriction enzyme M protein